MDTLLLFESFGLALAAGLLLGFERELSMPRPDDGRSESYLAGARTFPLVALLGATAALLAGVFGWVALVLPFVALGALVLVSYSDDVRRGSDRGLTSEVALILTFVLGALAMTQDVFDGVRQKALVVGAVAVTSTLLLSLKPRLQAFLERVSREDVFATLKFLVVLVIVLPLLPNEAMGPLGALNPWQIGLMVVLIAGISFVGYVTMRLFGAQRGLGFTGLVGGLASSTAVTLSFSARAKAEPALANACALAVVLASSIMPARVLVEVSVVNPSLLAQMAYPMGAMIAVGLVAAGYLYWRSRSHAPAGEIRVANPFQLSTAVKFALVFALVLLASKVATTYFGTGATYLAGLLAGTTDVDAITLSMARLAFEGVASDEVAVTTILLGVVSNTCVKGGMALVLGGQAFGLRVCAALAAMLVAAGIGLVAVW